MKPCLNPILAVSLGVNPVTNKQIMKFVNCFDPGHENLTNLWFMYGKDNVFELPCGKCEACRINYAEEWSIRCQLESLYHPYNYFITLTYSNEYEKQANMKDLQRFFDRLEGHGHKNKFKYFAVMESAPLTNRKHFHLILFCDFELDLYDKTLIKGHDYYHSKMIDDKWKFGLYNIALFESTCARYVAKYVAKSGGDSHKSTIRMSRNIGKAYFYGHYQQIIDDNFQLYGQFGFKTKVPIPKSMFFWFKDVDCPEIENWKEFRKSLGKLYFACKARDLGAIIPESVGIQDRHRFIDKLRQKGRNLNE